MARRGPKPESASVKKQKGNAGRRPIGVDPEVSVTDEKSSTENVSIPRPDFLNEAGQEVWDRIAPRLTRFKLLAEIDTEAFARYCNNFGRWIKMQKDLDVRGETYESESPHGTYMRANPSYMISDRLERQLIAAEANFGLNPAERQRLFAARAAASLGGLFDPPQQKANASEAEQPVKQNRSPLSRGSRTLN